MRERPDTIGALCFSGTRSAACLVSVGRRGVRHEEFESFAAQPRCQRVEPGPLGFGEERARDVDSHLGPAGDGKPR
jgi:hypothetical protein